MELALECGCIVTFNKRGPVIGINPCGNDGCTNQKLDGEYLTLSEVQAAERAEKKREKERFKEFMQKNSPVPIQLR